MRNTTINFEKLAEPTVNNDIRNRYPETRILLWTKCYSDAVETQSRRVTYLSHRTEAV